MAETGVLATWSNFGFDDFLEILERRKWWLGIGLALGLLGGLVLYVVLPAQYSSATTILVEPQGVPEDFIRNTITYEIEYRLNTLQERVTSHASLNELIERIGADRLDPSGSRSREGLMGEIRKNLHVLIDARGRNPANFFELTYTARDPELAAQVAREFAALFISENIKDRSAQVTATAEFLDRELDRLRAEVNAQEERLREFRHDRMGALPTQLESNLRSLDRLNLELASNLEGQESATQRTALLRNQLSGSGVESGGTLSRLIRELINAERVYTDEHPNVVRLRQEVARLKAQAASPRAGNDAELLDPTIVALKHEISTQNLQLEARRRQEARIRADIDKLQVRVDETPRREQELSGLTRDYENLTDTYRDLLSKKYEAALARNLEIQQKGERFKVLRPARVPSSPAWPNLRLLLPAGMAFGLALSILMIAVSEFRNPAFRSVEALTRSLGLPVFASIPRIDNDEIYEELPSDAVDPKLVVYTAPESSPAEQYRGFLPAFLEAKDCRTLLVTSAARGDGKTLTCMNLAVTLATDLNKRVLVIDGDLRRPRTHRVMRVGRKRGLSDVLQGHATMQECAVNSKIPNLSILPAGPTVRNPLTLLTDESFFELLREAREAYDIVMIDSPPLLPVVDTKIIRNMADMVLFVVRADSTPRDAVIRSLQDMRDVAGVVFNEVSPGSFRRYYYYDAYSRYAYGDPVATSDEGARDV